jgi:hypothetical protein
MESFRALAATVHRGSESAGPHVGLYQSRYGLLGAADAVWCPIGDHTDSTRQGLATEASLFTDRCHCDATAIEDSVLRVAPLRRIRAALKVDAGVVPVNVAQSLQMVGGRNVNFAHVSAAYKFYSNWAGDRRVGYVPDLMAQRHELARPVVRTAAGFHANEAGGQIGEEGDHLAAPYRAVHALYGSFAFHFHALLHNERPCCCVCPCSVSRLLECGLGCRRTAGSETHLWNRQRGNLRGAVPRVWSELVCDVACMRAFLERDSRIAQ